jgi:benzodiazapine receptor
MNTKTTNSNTVQILNVIAFVAVVTVNILSNALPLNGRTAGEISDALPSFFTPAGYTFSIWGLIYTALLGFAVYQAFPWQRQKPYLGRIGWLFIVSSAINMSWLFAWHYGYYVLSVILMISLLLTLIAIYQRLEIGFRNPALTVADKLFIHLPFTLYLGWITVATIANVATVLAHLGWNGFGISGPAWSAIMMLVATVVAAVLLFNRRNLAYAGVLVWALFGIRSAHADIALIANTALISAIIITVFSIVGYLRTRRPATPIEHSLQTS